MHRTAMLDAIRAEIQELKRQPRKTKGEEQRLIVLMQTAKEMQHEAQIVKYGAEIQGMAAPAALPKQSQQGAFHSSYHRAYSTLGAQQAADKQAMLKTGMQDQTEQESNTQTEALAMLLEAVEVKREELEKNQAAVSPSPTKMNTQRLAAKKLQGHHSSLYNKKAPIQNVSFKPSSKASPHPVSGTYKKPGKS